MIAELPLQQRKSLALAILIILLLLVTLFVIKPFFSTFMDYGEDIESLEQQLSTYERLAQSLNQNRSELQQLQQNNPWSQYYLEQTKPALAAAGLQQYLNQLTRRHGGQVVSTKILNRNDDTPLQTVAIQVHLRMDISELVPLLHGLESGTPWLFIENFSVTANVRQLRQTRQQRLQQLRQRRQNPNQAITSNPNRPLDIRFDLIGYSAREEML